MASKINLQAQDFDKRLLIQKPVVVQNEQGEETIQWTNVATVWACIKPIRGREAIIANQMLAEMDTRIEIRYPRFAKDLNAKWRALYWGTIYNFVSIGNVESRNEYIEIMAQSGLNHG